MCAYVKQLRLYRLLHLPTRARGKNTSMIFANGRLLRYSEDHSSRPLSSAAEHPGYPYNTDIVFSSIHVYISHNNAVHVCRSLHVRRSSITFCACFFPGQLYRLICIFENSDCSNVRKKYLTTLVAVSTTRCLFD